MLRRTRPAGEAVRMDHFAAQYDKLRSLLSVFLGSGITSALLRLAGPALRLGARGDVPVELGGPPVLPPGEPWPRWNGRPLDFLGAIDFTDLAVFGEIRGVPSSGKAAFYYASDVPRPWGDAIDQREGWRVFTGDLREAVPPPGAVNYP